jgi:hypothetical protein
VAQNDDAKEFFNKLLTLTGRIKCYFKCPVIRVVSMGRCNTFLKFTRRSLKT